MSASSSSSGGVTVEEFGRDSEGRVVRSFTLRGCGGRLEISVVEYGATLISVKHGGDEITLCPRKSLEELRRNACFFGATIGRVCNRIAGGEFKLGGKTYSLPANNGPNCLHGGSKGFDKKFWRGFDATVEKGCPAARFELMSPDGDMGFPGTVTASVTFALLSGEQEECSMQIEYRATTTATTPLALTNHAYWNLASNFSAQGVLGHRLKLAPELDAYLPVDKVQIPKGKPQEVNGTPFDFSDSRVIGERIDATNGGYDHCYVVRNAPLQEKRMRMLARVHDPSSGRVMVVRSDQPGLQLYTGNFIPEPQKQAALCLETQAWPDAANQRPEQVLLKPGDEWHSLTEHSFSFAQ